MSEATSTITAAPGETFTHSAWVHNPASGHYDIEVGPRLTFRRTLVAFLKEGDVLMDTFGQPRHGVASVRATKRTIKVTFTTGDHETFLPGEVLNVFVSREDVARSFVPGVTPLDAV